MSITLPNMKRFFSLFLAAMMLVSLLAVNTRAAEILTGTEPNYEIDRRNAGALTKTDTALEYRILPNGIWTDVTGDTVTGLASGSHEIRCAAAGSEMPPPESRQR